MWDDINLNDCEEGEELNPSAYNPDDYPTKEEMLDFISLNCNKPPVNIDLKELSVNGVVIEKRSYFLFQFEKCS